MVDTDILKQHREILVNALVELANNNTKSLIDDDIINGVIEVPLEAMDILKQRLINIAKNNNLILDNDKFNEVLSVYKNKLKEEFRRVFLKRIKLVEDIYSKIDVDKPLDVVKTLKRELNKFNKESKKEYKEILIKLVKSFLVDNLDLIVKDSNDKFKKDATKFLESVYVKQVLETLEMKILVKDTILINSLKEQIERFVFTKENSHLFD